MNAFSLLLSNAMGQSLELFYATVLFALARVSEDLGHGTSRK